MNRSDYNDLDGHLLQLLLAVVETGSITGDALFVKSGRGVVATAHAEQLAVRARALLIAMAGFAAAGSFDPTSWRATITIAANDFQRTVLLPQLMSRLRQKAPGVVLRVMASNIPSLEMLRQEQCQLVISPRPPSGSDIMQKRLFENHFRVFYDAAEREAPRSRADYLSAEHITVVYEPQRALDIDQWLLGQGVQRRFQVMVPGFAALPDFMRGSRLLATAPGLLQSNLFQGLASAPVPVTCPPMPMFMVWHQRYQNDASHQWLREELTQVAAALPLVSPAA